MLRGQATKPHKNWNSKSKSILLSALKDNLKGHYGGNGGNGGVSQPEHINVGIHGHGKGRHISHGVLMVQVGVNVSY